MDSTELRETLAKWSESLDSNDREDLMLRLRSLSSVYPFNEYEYRLMYLLDKSAITFQDYTSLRESYVTTNKYLELFELAPRIFGEIWGQQHIMDLDSRFCKPEKALNGEYDGQYDLWIEGVRVEVKAARAIDTRTRGSLVAKALAFSDNRPFWMNFQQLKADAADIFIFIGVWIDTIRYWILSADEIRSNPSLSHQHRGGVEYQIGIRPANLADFDKYVVQPSRIGDITVLKGCDVRSSSPPR